MITYYEILGIKKEATFEEIKRAYKKRAVKYHSDNNPEDKIAEEAMKQINEAYETLSDINKRAEYDLTLNNTHDENNTSKYTEAANDTDNETVRVKTMELLKEAIDNAKIGRQLKEIISSNNTNIHIYTFIQEFSASIVFRFFIYLIIFFIIYIIIPLENYPIIDFIMLILYFALSIFDPYHFMKNTGNRVSIKFKEYADNCKEKVEKAAKKYNENKDYYEKLYKILPEKYSHIKVAENLYYYLQTGKAYCIEQAIALYNSETAENKKRNDAMAKKAGIVGIGAVLAAIFLMFKIIFFIDSFNNKKRF